MDNVGKPEEGLVVTPPVILDFLTSVLSRVENEPLIQAGPGFSPILPKISTFEAVDTL
ncbi:MAG: hypothetical protein NTU98_05040 [Bacteroidetes bacterium]|nr:hypothetical protein [Bacteroidota bacterium]